jgi:hypothetical protein
MRFRRHAPSATRAPVRAGARAGGRKGTGRGAGAGTRRADRWRSPAPRGGRRAVLARAGDPAPTPGRMRPAPDTAPGRHQSRRPGALSGCTPGHGPGSLARLGGTPHGGTPQTQRIALDWDAWGPGLPHTPPGHHAPPGEPRGCPPRPGQPGRFRGRDAPGSRHPRPRGQSRQTGGGREREPRRRDPPGRPDSRRLRPGGGRRKPTRETKFTRPVMPASGPYFVKK